MKEAFGTWSLGDLCMSLSKDLAVCLHLTWLGLDFILTLQMQLAGAETSQTTFKCLAWRGCYFLWRTRPYGETEEKSTKRDGKDFTFSWKARKLYQSRLFPQELPHHPVGLCIDAQDWQLHIYTLITTLNPDYDVFTPYRPHLIRGPFLLWWSLCGTSSIQL